MKYRHIILVFLSLSLFQLASQELEQVVPQKPKNSVIELPEPSLSNQEIAIDEDPLQIADATSLDRDPATYHKEEYLNKLLKQTYYQKLLTPSWSKYINPPSWKKNVLKWRYWNQLKNYIGQNDKQVLVIRTIHQSMEDTTTIDSSEISLDSVFTIDPDTMTLASMTNEEDDIIPVKESIPKEKIPVSQNNSSKEPTLKPKPVVENPKPKNSGDIKSTNEKVATVEKKKTDTQKDNKEKLKSGDKVVAPKIDAPQSVKIADAERKSENAHFISRLGQLPWPVSKGKITDGFGIRKNPEERGLRPENYGIDMVCPAGQIVKSVHNGTVLMAQRQSPYDFIVTVKHDEFTTAYYYMITSYVQPGDLVKEGQALGQLRTSVSEADFHFEIWNNQDRVNPELWLQKR